MNKKAFTLTELIAVIIIIALISLFAIPAVIRIKDDNVEKEKEYYYNSVKEASLVYSKSQSDMLGGVNDDGCLEVEIETLVNEGYLKEYTKEEIVDSKIVLRNKKGHVTSKVYLEFQDSEYGELDTGGCINYDHGIKNTLRDTLVHYGGNGSKIKNGFVVRHDETDDEPYNYVWYSGKLWRAFYTDSKTKQVKLISDEVLSINRFDKENGKNFNNSSIKTWLNEYFLNTLYNPNKYIANHSWEYKPNEKIRAKVGLITKEEASNEELDYLRTKIKYWTITPGTTGTYLMNNETPTQANANISSGIRPVIYLNANIIKTNGNGTRINPYELEGNEIKEVRLIRLSSTKSGEYVRLGGATGELFRIISIEKNGSTKLISVNPIDINGVTTFPMGTREYALSNVHDKIESYLNEKNLNKYLTAGQWCVESKAEQLDLTGCVGENYQTFIAGLPRYGELYTADNSYNGTTSHKFWTLTSDLANNTTDKYITYNSNGTSSKQGIGTPSKIKYMVYASKNVTVKSGRGTLEKPFIVD